MSNLPWFHKGLSFKCTGCGQCCTGSPGYVWISKKEVEEMAGYLKISPEDFIKRYTRLVGNHLSLLESPTTYDCVFLKGKQCQIYPVRPEQCKAFPWWKENLETPEAWEEAASRCEGINHVDAPLISLREIQEKTH